MIKKITTFFFAIPSVYTKKAILRCSRQIYTLKTIINLTYYLHKIKKNNFIISSCVIFVIDFIHNSDNTVILLYSESVRVWLTDDCIFRPLFYVIWLIKRERKKRAEKERGWHCLYVNQQYEMKKK